MHHILDQIRRTTFGKRSEKVSEDQLLLGQDDLDVAHAELKPAPFAISFGINPMVLIRPEGAWDSAGPLDQPLIRPSFAA